MQVSVSDGNLPLFSLPQRRLTCTAGFLALLVTGPKTPLRRRAWVRVGVSVGAEGADSRMRQRGTLHLVSVEALARWGSHGWRRWLRLLEVIIFRLARLRLAPAALAHGR